MKTVKLTNKNIDAAIDKIYTCDKVVICGDGENIVKEISHLQFKAVTIVEFKLIVKHVSFKDLKCFTNLKKLIVNGKTYKININDEGTDQFGVYNNDFNYCLKSKLGTIKIKRLMWLNGITNGELDYDVAYTCEFNGRDYFEAGINDLLWIIYNEALEEVELNEAKRILRADGYSFTEEKKRDSDGEFVIITIPALCDNDGTGWYPKGLSKSFNLALYLV